MSKIRSQYDRAYSGEDSIPLSEWLTDTSGAREYRCAFHLPCPYTQRNETFSAAAPRKGCKDVAMEKMCAIFYVEHNPESDVEISSHSITNPGLKGTCRSVLSFDSRPCQYSAFAMRHLASSVD
jgi:hypothetical protein